MSRSFSVSASRAMPYESMKRRVMYENHMGKLLTTKPTLNTKSHVRSFSVDRPWKMDYSKVISQRKILNEEIQEGKRQRDLYRKRRDEFEKRFNAAVGYKNPIQTASVRKAIDKERQIIKDNVLLMRRLKDIRNKETLNASISSAKTSSMPKNAGMSARTVHLGGYDMTDVRQQYQPYLITKVDLPKLKVTSMPIPISRPQNRFKNFSKTAEPKTRTLMPVMKSTNKRFTLLQRNTDQNTRHRDKPPVKQRYNFAKPAQNSFNRHSYKNSKSFY